MRSLVPLTLYLLGLALVFVGERVFGPGYSMRVPLDALAVVSIVTALGLRGQQWSKASGETRKVLGHLLPAYAVAGAGPLLVLAVAEGSSLAPGPEGDLGVLLHILGLLLLLLGGLPLVLMEVSLSSMYGARRLETRRLAESGRAGTAAALAISFVVALNFVANVHDQRFDLRTVRDLTPTESTVEMVRNLNKAITVSLFFSPANEVEELVAPYFESLTATGDNLVVHRRDRARHPREAKDLRVRKNGTIVISDGDNHESITLDEKAGKARSKLKKLDEDFQKRLNKVIGVQRVAYFTIGHGERSTSPKTGDPGGLKQLKEGLKALNYKVKNLGLKEGLSDQVPNDATLVFVVGPEGPMLEAERDALVRYVQGGGALALMIDPVVEEDPNLQPLLEVLGLVVHGDTLAHETSHATRTRGIADRTLLVSNRFTTHDSTRHLSELGSRIWALFETSGYLEKLKAAEGAAPIGAPEVTFTIRAPAGTWADLDGELRYDKNTETKKGWNLAAAVQLPVAEGADGPGGRAIVTADADILSDLALSVGKGNRQWVADAVRWLENEVQLGGQVADLEDVRILHTQDDDKAWFFGTTLGVPLLVLVLGFGSHFRRRRRTTS